jgi:hypothetical protein
MYLLQKHDCCQRGASDVRRVINVLAPIFVAAQYIDCTSLGAQLVLAGGINSV